MRILLTGATGFIGSHLARLLTTTGHEVSVVIRPLADRWRIAEALPALRVIQHDLSEHAALRAELTAWPPDLCIHPAWRGWSGPSLTAEDNIWSLSVSLEFLRILFHVGCRRFVGVGTCFEYDTDVGTLAEDTPTRPRDLYGFCKHSLHVAAQHLARLGRMEVAWARVFHVFGPYDDARRLVPSIALSLLRDLPARVTPGEQVRDFLHVEDAASAIWAVARSGHCGAVNVASGTPTTVAEIAKEIGNVVGRPDLVRLGALPYRPDEPRRLIAVTRILRETIRWSPRHTLQSGLHDTVGWWKTRA